MLGAVLSRAGPLRERPFRVLFVAQAVSLFGDYLVPLALAFAVLDLTGSARDLGIVLTARVLPTVLFILAGGVWADRLPRHSLMISSHLARAGIQALLAALLVTGHARIWELALLQALHGTATAFYRPASSGVVPQVVSRERLQEANALMWLTLSAGSIVGPAVSSALVLTVGPGWAILGDAVSFLLAAVVLARLRIPDAPPSPRQSFLRDLSVGWQAVRSRTWVWTSIAHFSLFQLVFLGSFTVLGPVVAKDQLGGAGAWALITAATGLGSLAGGLAALRIRPRHPLRAAFTLILGSTPSLLLLAVAAPAPAIAAAELLTGFAFAFGGSLWETTLQEKIPAETRSRVASYDWMGSTALRPVGLAVAGSVAAALGVRPTLMGAAAIVVGASVAILAVPDVRDLVRHGAAGPADVAPADY